MPVGGDYESLRKDLSSKAPSPSTLLDNGSKTSLISRVRRSLSTASSPNNSNHQKQHPIQGTIRRQLSSTLAGPSSSRLADSIISSSTNTTSMVHEPFQQQDEKSLSKATSLETLLKQQDHYHNVTTHTSKRSPPVSPTKMAKSSSSSSSSTRSSSRPQSPAQRPIDEEHHGTLYIPSMAFSNRWKRQSNKSQRLKNMVVSNQVSVMWAPAPAMYWSQPTVHGVVPKPVRAHTSVAVNDLMYVFGGSGNNGCSHILYALEMDTFKWIKPRTSGERPPATRAHSIVAHHEKIYTFGGGDGSHYTNDLYVLDTKTMVWSKPDTLGPRPCPRRAHSSFIWRDTLYIFGGGDDAKALNDLHALNLDAMTWMSVDTKGQKPHPRGYHSGTLVMDKFTVFGGSDGNICFDDVHILNLETSTWTWIDAHVASGLNTLPKRLSHAAVGVGSYIFITGGHDGTRYCSDLILFNLATMTWETRKVYGQDPSSRGYHTAVLHDSRLFLYGGYDGKKFYNEIAILDLSASAYLPQITKFTIDVP
ncbi:galactose oxidase [Lichtheimia corymbifera JMRC:FSU:9682]|uniref:Galactose oxidase n=1 Tax=Lichtheimia corymbifera JMRC:FSU:9682 TaxID=1263082 RepID=A0A068S4J3_9FUNG|nr:galactose oxidase [Lichtheimia corymbifera JMRC:FSU:9682]